MVKRCIGIDIGSSWLCAVQIARIGEEFHIEKVFSTQTRRSTDSPPDILRSLLSQHGFDRRADVAVSMPHDTVFFRGFPQGGVPNLQPCSADGSSALQDHFPIEPDELVTQVYSKHSLSGDKFSVLTAAAGRESLRERLDVLAQAKMRPKLIDAPIFVIHSVVSVNHPEVTTGTAIIAYVDECWLALAVTQDGNILAVRNIPLVSGSDNDSDVIQQQIAGLLSREAEITWRKVFGSGIEPDCKIYLVTAGNISDGLKTALEENLHCSTAIVDPCAKLKTLPDCKAGQSQYAIRDTQFAIAEGLALRVLAPEQTKGINFLGADNADIKPRLNLKKELVICAALVGMIVVFWLAGLFMRLSDLETNYSHIKNEITEVFQSTLPQEKNMVSPLVQLEQKLASFRKDYQLFASFYPNNLSPLEVLHSITTHRPSQANVKVDDFLIAADTVRISGTCDSFESVYQWQRLLQEVPGFNLVDVQDVQRQPQSGVVQFTMLLSSRPVEGPGSPLCGSPARLAGTKQE